ncbi:MAG: D-alanyl-D-alanine endopeptidase [Aquabacterium sp.]|jgi:D-alanyl-D-alanine endopeptidase (penicillin-binding protein 7)|nr:MAG: D-alanyl-D-alanine endopeptidase [Aquabacterium sp.]
MLDFSAGRRCLIGALMFLLAFAWTMEAHAATRSASAEKRSASAKTKAKSAARKAAKKPAAVKAAPRSRKAAARIAAVDAAPKVRRASIDPVVYERPSFGQAFGLHQTQDPLALKSSVALVLDQDTNEVLFSKNSDAVLPVASLTKLMTALVVVEANQPLDEVLTITEDDVDTAKFSHSRLAVGTRLTREEMLHLALMSSENRAANALGRNYPGGLMAAVLAMNRKAQELGMTSTRYVEPTGLSSHNQSSAHDLALLVKSAYGQSLIRELSTSPEYQVVVGSRQMQFRNTNSLVRSPIWDIGLQKTGYIAEAGRCLVMQARLAGRKLIMVFLDSAGRYSRQADAERVRRWLETPASSLPSARPAATPRVTS